MIEFEVEAIRANFGRVDSTSALSQSYEIPTPTAVEGICTSIVGIHRKKQTVMKAQYVKLCSDIRTDMETTNSYCIGRKQSLVSKKSPQQERKIFLVNQRWIFGVSAVCSTGNHANEVAVNQMFARYIEKFRQVRSTCCGHSEMFPSYVGPVRQETKVNVGYTKVIPDFLIRTYDALIDGKYSPVYSNVLVVRGFLDYASEREKANVF